MSKVWLVTGSSRGLGRLVVQAALATGDRVVAGARDPHTLADLIEQHGSARLRAVAQDVTDPVAAEAAVRTALDAFGRLDVLVNNAGYGHFAPFEQADADDFRAQIETSFFGAVYTTRAALPVMREQKSGHIIHVSSVGGRLGTPGLAAYQSAKWAMGGFAEVLREEVKTFGVKVTAIEPGGMGTGWGPEARNSLPPLLPEYEASLGPLVAMFDQYIGNETGSAARVADVIVKLARHDDPPAHLLLGSDAVHYASMAEAARAEADSRWREVSLSTDLSRNDPVPPFPQT